jgi:hypothetical protein
VDDVPVDDSRGLLARLEATPTEERHGTECGDTDDGDAPRGLS